MNPWGWPKRLLLEGVVALILALTLVLGLAGCLPPPYREMPPAPPPPSPVAPPPAVSRPVMYVIANRLNLRACPGMDCPRISVLEHNEEVEKVGEAEDWFQVRVRRDGRLGWVSAKHLSPTPAPPVPEAPPLAPAPPAVPPPVAAPPAAPEKPPEAAEKPAPPKPPAIPKKKAEERPAKPPKVEAAEPPPKPKPPAEKAAPAEKPAPPPEKPAPAPEPEQPKKIRIM